jgi:hypothetical protein
MIEKSSIDPLAIEEFKKASLEYLAPLAKEFGFDFEEIDSCLFALISKTISAKVYFPECHGYDVDVKITATLSKEWYSPQEKSIDWIGQFLGLDEFAISRGTSKEHIARMVKLNADYLRQALPLLISADENFWDDLSLFIQKQISNEDELDKQSAEERHLSEVRYEIEAAWQAKNYAKVVLLFEEIKEKMTVAEIKKLEYAQKHVP